MTDNRNRAFHYAILASLALHALLLVAFPDLIDTARRAVNIPPQIIARLMEPEPEPVPVAPAEEVRREPAPARKPAKPAPVLTPPAPEPLAREMTIEKPTPPIEAPSSPAPAAAPPLAAVGPQTASPPQSPAQQPAPAPESLSRDQYKLQLIDEAVRHKRYPPLARDNNWQGVVGVNVAVAANGRPSVTLKSSSGYEVLDRQALEMFAQAARTVPVPPALRGQAFALELPVRYNLED